MYVQDFFSKWVTHIYQRTDLEPSIVMKSSFSRVRLFIILRPTLCVTDGGHGFSHVFKQQAIFCFLIIFCFAWSFEKSNNQKPKLVLWLWLTFICLRSFYEERPNFCYFNFFTSYILIYFFKKYIKFRRKI